MPPAGWRAALPRAPATATRACHRAAAKSGRAQGRRCPANAGWKPPHPARRGTGKRSQRGPQTLPAGRRQRPPPETQWPPHEPTSCFPFAVRLRQQVGGGVGQQRDQRDDHRQVDQQLQIAAHGSLPSELADAGQIAEHFDRDRGGERKTHGNPRQGQQLRSGNRQNVTQQNPEFPHPFCPGRQHMRQGGTACQQIARVIEDLGKDDQPHHEASRRLGQNKQKRQHRGRNAKQNAGQ